MSTPVFELKNIDYYFDNKQVLENINIKINNAKLKPEIRNIPNVLNFDR